MTIPLCYLGIGMVRHYDGVVYSTNVIPPGMDAPTSFHPASVMARV